MNHNRYAFLDGMRGLVALFVLTRHTKAYWGFEFYRSYLAVDVFFILSGFVIAYAYDQKIMDGRINFGRFVLIRLIRLYPVFLLSLLLCVSLVTLELTSGINVPKASFDEILYVFGLTAFFLPSQWTGSQALFPVNGPYWSLFFELISNFFYALVRPFLSNVILIAILFSAFALIALSAFHHGSMDNGFKWGIESIVMGLSRSVFGIFLGLWLHRHETVIKRYAGKFMSPFVGALLIVLVLISPKVGQFDWLVDLVSVAIIFPFCVICGAQGSNSRLLRPILLVLGSASYPLYVLHKPFGEMMSILGGKIEVGYAPFSGLVLIAILVPLCVLIETYYDIPLRRWLTNSVFRKRDAV